MTKELKIAIILGVGLVASGASYYFLIYKPGKIAKTDPNSNTGASIAPIPNKKIFPPANPAISNPIGKVAYANTNGVKVLLENGSTYETINKDTPVGTIESLENKGDNKPFYKTIAGLWVAQGLVYVK